MTTDDLRDDFSESDTDTSPDSLRFLAWQDAWLLEIYIDRTEPGHRDVVRLVVEWPDAENRPLEPVSLVDFHDCYALELDMGFGVIAEESIAGLTIEEDHPRLARIAEEFGTDDVTCVRIDLANTRGTLRIFTSAVTVLPDTSYVTLH
ncbi:hypothetical protein [Sagittula sp. S175]|uniref:hypothetical protein n=1 Tax=Sagittula sp. S175 TaxID=3415129 RepID=UPI003C7C30B7